MASPLKIHTSKNLKMQMNVKITVDISSHWQLQRFVHPNHHSRNGKAAKLMATVDGADQAPHWPTSRVFLVTFQKAAQSFN